MTRCSAFRSFAAIGALAAAIASAGCWGGVPDPDDLPGDEITKRAKGERFLDRALAAHGGARVWREMGAARFTLRDTWVSRLEFMRPYPVTNPELRLTFDYHGGRGRLEFPEHPETLWGTRGVEGWGRRQRAALTEDAAAAATLIPGLARLVGMPFVFADPRAAVYYAGKTERAGRAYESLLVVLPEARGGAESRYLALFDATAGTLARIEYTLPGRAGIVEGYADYPEWMAAADLLVPKRIEMGYRRPIEAPTNTIEVERVEIDVAVDDETFAPPARPPEG